MYLNISLTSAETGKSWYIFGSYASRSGVLYSFCPPPLAAAAFSICDDGEFVPDSSCVSSSLLSSYEWYFKLNDEENQSDLLEDYLQDYRLVDVVSAAREIS